MRFLLPLLMICMGWFTSANVFGHASLGHSQRHPYYHFKQLSIRDGLPASITSLYSDRLGSLWVGTPVGIYRFNGEKIRKYPLPAVLEADQSYVFSLAGDSQNRIWACTSNGLCHYDFGCDSLKAMLRQGKPLQAHIVVTQKDHLFISADDTLFVYDSRTMKEVKSIPTPHRWFSSIVPMEKNLLLVIDNNRKMWLIDWRHKQLKSSPIPDFQNVYCMLRDSRGDIWVSYYGQAVKCYTPEGRLLQEYHSRNSAMTNDAVIDMAEWNHEIWLATDGGGIQIIRPGTSEVQVISGRSSDRFPANSIACLYPDNDNIWVGTVHEGVLNIESGFMTTYSKAMRKESAGLSAKCSLCLWEDTDGRIWIGTDGGGLNSYNPKTGQFVHYAGMSDEKIVSICPLFERELLVSCFQTDLFRFDKTTGKFTRFVLPEPSAEREMLGIGYPVNLLRTPGGEIEMYGKTAYRYHPVTKTLTPIRPNIKTQSSWIPIGPYKGGMVYFDRCKVFLYHPQDDKYHILMNYKPNQLLAARVDKKGVLWVSTTEGVCCKNLDTRSVKPIELPDKNSIVTSLVIDENGTVWMGAMNGIYAYYPRQDRFVTYTEMDGVLPNDFLPKATLVSSTGNIYMGGTEGFVRIDETLIQPKRKSSVAFPVIELYDGKHISYIRSGEEMKLPFGFSSLQVHPLQVGENILRKRMYRFCIRGMKEEVIETSHPHFTLYRLAPGSYTISVQCTQQNGYWGMECALFHLVVSPPWWRQGWFLGFCVLLAMCLTGYGIRAYNLRLKRQLQEKERLMYKDKVRALININHELRTPLTLIYAPLKQLTESRMISPDVRSSLYKIFKQARQMKTIIDMILDLHKMEMGKNILHLSLADPNQWLQVILDGFKDEFSLRRLSLSFSPSAEVEEMFFAQAQCEIIVNNLLENAYKFCKEGSTVNVTTEVTEAQTGKFLRIAFEGDTWGGGQEDMTNLFTQPCQDRIQYQGSGGIGLLYAKQLVELQGGTIGAYNNERQGTTFFFTLPCRKRAESILSEPQAYLNQTLDISGIGSNQQKQFTVKDRFHSVLLVDDDPDFCQYMAENMRQLFDNVYQVHDGIEVIPFLTKHLPQLIISDIKMPRMNGLELCKYIKQNPDLSHLPIVLLTACVDDYSVEQAYNVGAEAFVTKPFDMDLLLMQLQNIMQNHNLIKKRYISPLLTMEQAEGDDKEETERFLLEITRIVNEHLSDVELDVNFIAREMGMSRASLYNKLKGTMDIGLINFIQQTRIDYACKLLAETSLPIVEISEKVGFRYAKNFCTKFKNIVGVTPTEYRKKNR